MKAEKKELRELAEKLAVAEGNIYYLKDFSGNNPLRYAEQDSSDTRKPPKNGMNKWIIISVICLLIFPPIAIYTFYVAYKANKVYKKAMEEWMEEGNVRDNLAILVENEEQKRKELLERLQKLCEENPGLDGNYWWKLGMDPTVHGVALEALLPGKEAKRQDWNFALLNQMWFRESGNVYYLEDMTSYNVFLEAKDALSMLEPEEGAVIYRDNSLLTKKAEGYALLHLYAYAAEPIEEVTKSTTRTAIDKEAERAAYRQKLDATEIILNGIGSRNLMTSEEMQMTGRMSMEDYVQDQLVRGMYEADFESKLSARGDYDEHTVYSRGFHGLYHIVFYDCADILLSIEDSTLGRCAAIIVPRKEQKLTQLFVRSSEKNNPFAGRIESYDGNPGFSLSDSEGCPSIKMAVENLFTPAEIEFLHLKDRDVLEERPEGLDEYEFVYLIWKDNPKGRLESRK